MRISSKLVLALFVTLSFNFTAAGQKWQRITPLKSTCDEIKSVFGVTKCSFPVSRFEFPKFKLTVEFIKRRGRSAVAQRVSNLIIIYKELVPLNETDLVLREFKIKPVSDVEGGMTYVNPARGIELETKNVFGSGLYVTSIRLRPRAK